MDISLLLDKSAKDHDHLCPRQVLGVRIGLAGMRAVGFREPPHKKEMLVITETDGCFVDGVIAATNCSVGHRTLCVVDYGKVAATFVNIQLERAIRVTTRIDVRDRACGFVPEKTQRYAAQLQAYQIMPDEEMLTVQEVMLNIPIWDIVSSPGIRVNCEVCGEEIMNGREIYQGGITLCRSCAGEGYYQAVLACDLRMNMIAG